MRADGGGEYVSEGMVGMMRFGIPNAAVARFYVLYFLYL
jgi:hypothetical protein